jgi:hypothetical protein
VCYSYNETVITILLKSVTKIRLVKAGEDEVCSDLRSMEINDSVILICTYYL